MHRGGYGGRPSEQGLQNPRARAITSGKEVASRASWCRRAGLQGGKATLSKSSPKPPHQNTLRKEGITQKSRGAQGKQPSMCSVFLQARLCRRLITDLIIRLGKKLLSHPLLLVHEQEPQALHKPHNVSKIFLMNLFGT